MNYRELMQQPNNVLFYENDITAPQLFQKVETVKDDIIIREFDVEFEQCRLGLREMSEADKNSKVYTVFNREQLNTLNEFFTLAYFEAE